MVHGTNLSANRRRQHISKTSTCIYKCQFTSGISVAYARSVLIIVRESSLITVMLSACQYNYDTELRKVQMKCQTMALCVPVIDHIGDICKLFNNQ